MIICCAETASDTVADNLGEARVELVKGRGEGVRLEHPHEKPTLAEARDELAPLLESVLQLVELKVEGRVGVLAAAGSGTEELGYAERDLHHALYVLCVVKVGRRRGGAHVRHRI
jgi:hypothetical protein